VNNLKGISLPEILIGVSIAAVAGALIVNLLVSSNVIFFNQGAKIRQGLSLNDAAREITTSIKSSSGVVGQYPPSGTPQFSSGPAALVLKLPSINQSGNVIDQVFDYVVITKDASSPKILRKYIFVDNLSSRNAENKVLATALKESKFEYFNASFTEVAPTEAVRVNFTIDLIESTSVSESESSTTGSVNLKN
jgi:hypothetical protein